MNFEITQKTPAQRAEMNKFLGNVPILTEMPEADAEKAGQVFIMQDTGRRWVYNDGRWAGLPVGEPCPEVGYKELYIILSQSGTNPPVAQSTIINEIGEFTLGRTDVGRYNIVINGAFPSGKVITYTPKSIATGAGGSAGKFIRSTRLNNDTVNLICNQIEAPTGPIAAEYGDSFDLYIRVQG